MKRKLIWGDLETTGTVPEECIILEVAIAIADFDDPYNYEHVYQNVVKITPDDVAKFDPFIINMHTKNGLIDECLAATMSVQEIEQDLLKHIPLIEEKDDKPILAGSSIWFDHTFFKKHMPLVDARVTHRHYDVSALKLFAQSKGMDTFPKAEAHRAKDDIDESIARLKKLDEWLYGYYWAKGHAFKLKK